VAFSVQASDEHSSHKGHEAVQTSTSMSQGEVRKIDAANQKITLRHGPIANIGMPPMTMVFQVRKPDQLDGLKVGDKVQFVADKQGSQYGVSELQKAE
jgi:Cu/Ag efflux protein CusF